MPEALQTGKITASEVPLPNDEYLLVQWAKADTMDGRTHIVETITDITHTKRQQLHTEVLNRQLETANGELRNLNQLLKDHSVRDGLTGLYNHAYFVEMLQQMGAQAKRSGEPLSLLFLDYDNFKSINDTYGHTTGDQVLREMGRLLNGQLPMASFQWPAATESGARAMCLPATEAKNLLSSCRTHPSKLPLPWLNNSVRLLPGSRNYRSWQSLTRALSLCPAVLGSRRSRLMRLRPSSSWRRTRPCMLLRKPARTA